MKSLSRSAVMVIVQAAAMALRFVMLAVAARVSSLAEFGAYSLVASVLAWSSVVVMGGWPAYMLATVPKEGLRKDRLRSAERKQVLGSVLVGVVQAVILYFTLGANFAVSVAAAASWLLLGMSLATLLNETHRATGRAISSRISYAVIPPLISTALMLAWHESGHRVTASVLVLCIAAGWFGLAISARCKLRDSVRDVAPNPQRSLTFSRRDFFVIKLSQAVLASADVVVVGMLIGVEAAALYGVARRIATVAGIGLNSITMLYGPQLSRAINSPQKLRRLTRESTVLSAAFSAPMAVGLGAFGGEILAFFGAEYQAAEPMLWVLLLGTAISGLFGPIGTVVHVNGQEAVSRTVMVVAVATFLVCLPIFVSSWGALGAAWAWVIATVLWNLLLWMRVDYGTELR